MTVSDAVVRAFGGSFEAGNLRFDTFDDAVNYFGEIAQDAECLLAAEKRVLAENYLNGDSALNVDVFKDFGAKVGQFTLFSVPFAHKVEVKAPYVPAPKADAAIGDGVGGESAVYFAVPQIIKLPEGFFPAFVRLISEQKGEQGLRDLCVLACHVFGCIAFSSAEGELRVFRSGVAGEIDDGVVHDMIERGPQAIYDFKRNDRKLVWKGRDPRFGECVPRAWVSLVKESVGLFFEEDALLDFKLGQVLPGPINQELRASIQR